MANIDNVNLSLLGHAIELERNEPTYVRRNSSRIVCRHLIDSDVVVWLEAGRRPAWHRCRGVGEGSLRRKRQRQSMVLVVAAHIAVQLKVSPCWRQMRAVRPDVARGAGLACLDRERRHSERRSHSQDCG